MIITPRSLLHDIDNNAKNLSPLQIDRPLRADSSRVAYFIYFNFIVVVAADLIAKLSR